MAETEIHIRALRTEEAAYAQTFIATQGDRLALEGDHILHSMYVAEEVAADGLVVATLGAVACSWNPWNETSATTVSIDKRINGRRNELHQAFTEKIALHRELLGLAFPVKER